ncbi:ventral expressed homeobox [Acanthopagrus latus]|uniref:ventral expressed homeobox n=1 Tax=Acanthopagrus latus TaxID=8177 RepID=UPI00187BF9FB|nr:ventral expressed homeobox [Acanthopagrus latus]
MANFSVEWLARSCYEETTPHSEVHKETEGFKTSRSQCTPTSPNRRLRTKFTSEQVGRLEGTFSKHKYLGAVQRRKIAEKLSLSETQVKTWFQNRRMKLKREVQDQRADFLSVPASLLPPLLLQHPVLSGQLPAARSGFYPQLQPLHRAALPAAALHHPVLMAPLYY